MSSQDKKMHIEGEIPRASIKVLGVGGAGGNAVSSMVENHVEGVDFLVANTDAQALAESQAETRLRIGMKVTKGLGAGSNPEVGRRAAEEDLETIASLIAETDILFLTAGMGGGTGTGATPVIAAAARELGVLTVAVVTKPFMFEGKRRKRQAEEAIEILRKQVDTLIVIPNQKLLEVSDPKISMLDAFAMANDVLRQAIQGVSDIIVKPGHINVDFADVKAIMKGMGMAIMGTGRAKGEDRAKEAALSAINSPLVEDVCIEGARGILINITGNCGLGLQEINDAANVIYEKAGDDAHIILGSVINPDMGDEVTVTVIATGFEEPEEQVVVGHKTTLPSLGHLKKTVSLTPKPAVVEALPPEPVHPEPVPQPQAPEPRAEPAETVLQAAKLPASPIEGLLTPVKPEVASKQEKVESTQVAAAPEPEVARAAPVLEPTEKAIAHAPPLPEDTSKAEVKSEPVAKVAEPKVDAAKKLDVKTSNKVPSLSSIDPLKLPTQPVDLTDLDTPTFMRKKAQEK